MENTDEFMKRAQSPEDDALGLIQHILIKLSLALNGGKVKRQRFLLLCVKSAL